MKRILIIGATSAIAEAAARVWAQRGDELYLVARNRERLEAIANDLRVRGSAGVRTYCMDSNDHDAHTPLLETVYATWNELDIVLIAHGTLPEQKSCEQSVELTMQSIQTNALSVIALLTHIANRFEEQKKGTIAVISSVAGDRGRQSNYVYGSAKAMVTAFTSGLRQRLSKSGVQVVTIKPGFVDTPMTADIRKGLLWASPEGIAESIAKACAQKNGEVYVPGFWWGIMKIVKAIPEFVYIKLKL